MENYLQRNEYPAGYTKLEFAGSVATTSNWRKVYFTTGSMFRMKKSLEDVRSDQSCKATSDGKSCHSRSVDELQVCGSVQRRDKTEKGLYIVTTPKFILNMYTGILRRYTCSDARENMIQLRNPTTGTENNSESVQVGSVQHCT